MRLAITLFVAVILFQSACKNDDINVATPPIEYSGISDSLHRSFQKLYAEGELPGFAVSIFSADSIYFTQGYGYADVEKQIPYSQHTVQGIASISKTLIAVALMKAIEAELLTLETEINDILPFKVTNPYYPDIPITIRHLATHTSTIYEDHHYDKAYVFSAPLDTSLFQEAWAESIEVYNSNVSRSLEDFLMIMYSENGEWNSSDNYLKVEPGTSYEYSNIGAALLAYCVEIVTEQDYKVYTREQILDPLNMTSSAWQYDQTELSRHTIYYNEDQNPVPQYDVVTYPDGGLYSTVSDMTAYMQDMMRGWYGAGALLDSSSYKHMMTNQIPDLDSPTGVIWDMDNTCCIGHSGNDFGIATMAYFDPDTGIGKVLFTNISIEYEHLADQYYSIFNQMFAYDSDIIADLNNKN